MPNRVPTYCPPGRDPRKARREANAFYDRTRRDRRSKGFYNSAAWLRTRGVKLAQSPTCELCEERGEVTAAAHVHHKESIKARPDLALSLGNLQSLCHGCHSRVEAGRNGAPR